MCVQPQAQFAEDMIVDAADEVCFIISYIWYRDVKRTSINRRTR